MWNINDSERLGGITASLETEVLHAVLVKDSFLFVPVRNFPLTVQFGGGLLIIFSLSNKGKVPIIYLSQHCQSPELLDTSNIMIQATGVSARAAGHRPFHFMRAAWVFLDDSCLTATAFRSSVLEPCQALLWTVEDSFCLSVLDIDFCSRLPSSLHSPGRQTIPSLMVPQTTYPVPVSPKDKQVITKPGFTVHAFALSRLKKSVDLVQIPSSVWTPPPSLTKEPHSHSSLPFYLCNSWL